MWFYKYVSASGTSMIPTSTWCCTLKVNKLCKKLDLVWLAAGFIGAQRVFTCVDSAVRLWTVVLDARTRRVTCRARRVTCRTRRVTCRARCVTCRARRVTCRTRRVWRGRKETCGMSDVETRHALRVTLVWRGDVACYCDLESCSSEDWRRVTFVYI